MNCRLSPVARSSFPQDPAVALAWTLRVFGNNGLSEGALLLEELIRHNRAASNYLHTVQEAVNKSMGKTKFSGIPANAT
jgi:hypothetical protein